MKKLIIRAMYSEGFCITLYYAMFSVLISHGFGGLFHLNFSSEVSIFSICMGVSGFRRGP